MKDRNNEGKRINHFIFGKTDRPFLTPQIRISQWPLNLWPELAFKNIMRAKPIVKLQITFLKLLT